MKDINVEIEFVSKTQNNKNLKELLIQYLDPEYVRIEYSNVFDLLSTNDNILIEYDYILSLHTKLNADTYRFYNYDIINHVISEILQFYDYNFMDFEIVINTSDNDVDKLIALKNQYKFVISVMINIINLCNIFNESELKKYKKIFTQKLDFASLVKISRNNEIYNSIITSVSFDPDNFEIILSFKIIQNIPDLIQYFTRPMLIKSARK